MGWGVRAGKRTPRQVGGIYIPETNNNDEAKVIGISPETWKAREKRVDTLKRRFANIF